MVLGASGYNASPMTDLAAIIWTVSSYLFGALVHWQPYRVYTM